jgi:hypothetical protein
MMIALGAGALEGALLHWGFVSLGRFPIQHLPQGRRIDVGWMIWSESASNRDAMVRVVLNSERGRCPALC